MEDKENLKIYTSGAFAEMFNLSKRTLRRYQERGILPKRINPANNYFFFTEEDIRNFREYLESGNAKNRNK